MRITILSFFLLISQLLMAQKGTVRGVVKDAETGELMFAAVVFVKGTTIAASTDFDGVFELKLDPGTYTIGASFISYADFEKTNVVVKAGETTTIDIGLAVDENSELEEVLVKVKVDRGGEQILLMERKNSSKVIESIGAQELSEKGVSDVETGVTKLSGVSKVSSGGVFVRGLGDRYNNAYLNGLPIASPDPNKKIVDLNLFPTAMVSNINVSKVYTVDQFGDMSGASIDIVTREAIDDYVSVGVGVNYNSQTTFKDFSISRDGSSDYLGMSGSGRNAPATVREGNLYKLQNEDQNPFSTKYAPSEISAPLDNSFGVQFAKSFESDSIDANGGIMFSASYKNKYRQDEGVNKILDNKLDPTSDLYRERYRFSTNLTGYIGTYFEFKNRHKINLNYIFLNGSNNNYFVSQGNTDEDDEPELRDQRILRTGYIQKNLNDIQLKLEHTLVENLKLNWGGSYTFASTDEPDRMDMKAIMDEGETEIGLVTPDKSSEKQRYYQFTDENEVYAFGELAYGLGKPFDEDEDARHRIVGGVQTRRKSREIELEAFQLDINPGLFNGEPVELAKIDDFLSQENYDNGLFEYDVEKRAADFITASRDIDAGYVYADLAVTEKLKVVPGARVESSYQIIEFKNPGDNFTDRFRKSITTSVDILPALSLKYNIADSAILRFGVSKTLIRPNFRELVPLVYINQNLRATTGNPFLKNSDVYNVDAKYEIYPQFGELFSLGVYYKRILNPIEQFKPSENWVKYFNLEQSDVVGAEFEFSKRLENLVYTNSKFVNGLSVGGNISWLYSTITIDTANVSDDADADITSALKKVTNKERNIQGASPLLLNASISYDSLFIPGSKSTSISLVYNRFADRILSVGSNSNGDIYEKGFGTLDFVFQNSWESGWSVRFSIKNILNPKIERYQSASRNLETGDLFAGQENTVVQSYKTGINIGLKVSYKIGLEKKEEEPILD